MAVLNTTGWMRSEVITVPQSMVSQFALDEHCAHIQVSKRDGSVLAMVSNVPGFGTCLVNPDSLARSKPANSSVRVYQCVNKDSFVLENTLVRVVIDNHGRVTSFYDLVERRELVPKGESGNVFELYNDVPLYWDAWDEEVYLRESFKKLDGTNVVIVETGPILASVSVKVPISDDSMLTQTISLSATSPRLDFDCDIEWHENRKSLKTSFTWDITSDFATYETQYGVVQRPTHRNTSWDLAKFEVCAHKFADLSEYGYGVAVLNDCKYGHSTIANTMSLSLMRAPKSPDEHCDMGHHKFRYAIYPHKGTFSESKVVQEAYQFNVPLLHIPLSSTDIADVNSSPFFSVTGAPNVVLDAVKVAEEDGQSFIVRMYEAYGGHARALLTSRLHSSSITKVNILEHPMDNSEDSFHMLPHSNTVEVEFKPFEIVTLKFSQ
ncbi:Glycoside hydrolase, 38 vacuolar alpha mannosidase [Coemansia sp. RSA 2607]|nr:Glycoside hydrolase, 38 vacuolar alpha mannosidase [Coemansia sp. RSA 2607]